MTSTQHSQIRCRIYIHPSACTNPASVDAIQRRTGRLAIITTPERIELTPQIAETSSSLGGAAA